jgi:predicted protein tyrosine phosphatase
MNRIGNVANPNQGKFKKVLCVCSAGLLRSPTAAWVLSQEPYNFNTRAAGAVEDFALIPVDEVLLAWAKEVVCMSQSHASIIRELLDALELYDPPKVICLDIPDQFCYRDPELVELIKNRYDERKDTAWPAKNVGTTPSDVRIPMAAHKRITTENF